MTFVVEERTKNKERKRGEERKNEQYEDEVNRMEIENNSNKIMGSEQGDGAENQQGLKGCGQSGANQRMDEENIQALVALDKNKKRKGNESIEGAVYKRCSNDAFRAG